MATGLRVDDESASAMKIKLPRSLPIEGLKPSRKYWQLVKP